jgi:hypothetical protein
MQLAHRVRVLELQSAISYLKKNPMLMSDAEIELLAVKQAELDNLKPTPPPFPEGGDVDLRCPKAEIEEDVTRLRLKAKQLLDQLSRETDPARIARLEFEKPIQRLRAAENRLARKEQLLAWELWKGQQAEKRNAAGQ